jgi:hypothetical protein
MTPSRPPASAAFSLVRCGALGGTRTPNLLIRSQMLSPIELRAPVAETQGYLGAEAAPNRWRSYHFVPGQRIHRG